VERSLKARQGQYAGWEWGEFGTGDARRRIADHRKKRATGSECTMETGLFMALARMIGMTHAHELDIIRMWRNKLRCRFQYGTREHEGEQKKQAQHEPLPTPIRKV
jgi:hypothetical protein